MIMFSSLLFTLVVLSLSFICETKTLSSRCASNLTVPDTYSTTSSLQRVNLTKSNAKCNDGSTAVYYIGHERNTSKWIIYLEGGTGCYTKKECEKRYKEWPEYMSSHDYPPSIEGQGMFDSDPRINPDYWDYNMVFVPYCTSDLWLGVSGVAKGDFLFLGETIFHSVVDELMGRGMNKASEVVLVGSGTGGIGVLNLAGWLQSKLSKETTFSAILDSAWFINYDNNIDNLVGSDGSSRSPWLGLFRSTCGDTETVGYPCCISASCMLTNAAKGQTSRSQTAGFPNISYFVIFSQYDIFLLSNSLQKQSGVKDVKKRQMEWFRTMTEYGGEMKRSLNETARKANNMSYFVTSCLQHIYLRLSNLRRGKRSIHIFDISSDSLQYKSATNPDVWSTLYSVNGSSRKVTIQCAIHEWNQNRKMKRTVRYFDDCQGAGCNPHCPERVELGEMNSLWSSGASLVVDCLVLTATCICLVYKVVMMWRKYMLFKAYRAFINEGKISLETSNMALRRSDAIGVACLDLRYHVHLSHDAIRQVTEIEKGRRAEEDEAQYLLTPYIRSPQSSVDNSGKRLKKQGAVSEVNDNSSVEEVDLGTLRSLGNEQLVSGNDSRQWSSTNGRQNSHDDHKYMYDSKFGTLNVSCDKSIINGISSYFNPKEMVAIMGPSGCGKTTLLDLLTGRRRKGKCEGEIFVNGIPFVYLREWYKKHTGYVLQSAVPFYEEMTVRENLVLAAFLRLPRSLSADERFNRIENIIDQVGLNIVEDTIVGGSTGLGLSGGQKRRLAVAIQLLSLPRVLFLDEPTSGLDATSSMELLQHLQCIACSGRLVVLTIHQPRLEVFHMFDRILLLCQGEVAYYGSPMDAPTLFLKAYQVAKLEGDAPELDHNKNPADVIMDMLSSELGRKAILNYYKMTFERKNVKNAIKQAKRSYSDDELHEDNKQVDSGWMNRLLVLETRASLRMSTSQKLYLPSIFLLLSVVTGLAYLQAKDMLLIMAAFSIFSFSSSIFMFPPVYNHLDKALKMYRLEREDGIGKSFELLLQTFMRYVTISAIPLVVCSIILCLMVLPTSAWSVERFFYVILFSLALNQTWTSISIMLVCVFPVYGHKISPLVSCSAGFAGGFFIPPSRMKAYFLWLMYLNPSFYGYTGMLRLVLPELQTGCEYQSAIECYPDTGEFWMSDFGMDEVQPTLNLLILVMMTIGAFIVSWLSVEVRYSDVTVDTLKGFFFGRRSKDHGIDYGSQSTHSQGGEVTSKSEDSEAESETESLRDFQTGSPFNMETETSDEDSSERTVFSPVSKDKDTVVTFKFEQDNCLSPTKVHRQFSRRNSTRSYFLPDRKHSVFRPAEPSRDTSSLESRRNTIDDVRVSVARDTNMRRNHMKSSMKAFAQMQISLIKDDENLEALHHEVPIKRIQRRLSKRSIAVGRRRLKTAPSLSTDQPSIPECEEPV